MAKRKLLQWMRDKLMRHAEHVIAPRTEKDKLDAAYKQAEPFVRKIVHAKFPPRDMRVCQKYNVAAIDDCIKLQFPNGTIQVFNFADETGPLVTSKTYHGQIYLADEETAAAVEAWASAQEAYEEQRKKRLAAYRALIDGASYVDDVAAVWPEAGELIPLNSLPIPLGPDQINLVKADYAERAA